MGFSLLRGPAPAAAGLQQARRPAHRRGLHQGGGRGDPSWVEERGPTGWAELARSLGCTYKGAETSVREHYQILKDKQAGKRKDMPS